MMYIMQRLKHLKIFLLSRYNIFLIGVIYLTSSIVFGTYMYQVEGLSVIKTIYFLVTTSTTVGYGDISPSKELGMLLGMIYMIVSITAVGVLLGLIGEYFMKIGNRIKKGLIMVKRDVKLLIVGYPSEEKIKDLVEQLNQDESYKGNHIVLVSKSLDEKPLWFSEYNIDFVSGLGSDEDTLLRANIMNVEKALILAADGEDIRSDDFSSSTVSVIESMNPKVHTIVEKVRKSPALFIAAGADVITNVSSANLLAQEILNEGAIEFEKAIFDNDIEGTQFNADYKGEDILWKDIAFQYIMEGKIPEGFRNKGKGFNFMPSPNDIIHDGAVIKYRGK